MTGICGIASGNTVPGIQDRLTRMLTSMRHEPWHNVEQAGIANEQAAMGRVTLGFVNRPPQPVKLSEAPLSAVMDGELYDADVQRQRLIAAGHRFDGESHAEILIRGYLQHGREFFAQLNGKFSAAIHDGREDRLILTNDRFGMQPLYYAEPRAGEFVFASEIKSLLTDPSLPREQNPRGVIQFFTFGHLWGEETFYASIRTLPPAAWIEYDLRNDRLSADRYWSVADPPDQSVSRAAHLERIDEAFKNAVDVRTEDTSNLGISLSGGMDARSILAVIDHENVDLSALCMGMKGSRDQRSARQMAQLAGCDYHDFMLDADFLSTFETHLNRMVTLTDGHYLSQCIVMPTLPRYRELGIEVLLRGHAGELMHMGKAYSFSLDRDALSMTTDAQVDAWLFKHLQAYMLDAVDAPLFAFADAGEANEIARETIQTALAESGPCARPLDRIWRLFVTQRMRRETAMSLVKFGSVVETRVPFLDPELVDCVLAAPAEMKVDEEIQAAILRKRFPAFLDVTNVNTGARVGANRAVKAAQYFKMRVLAKLGVRGYQPYERLGLWLRRELKPLVQEILLNDRCLERGTFRADTVRTVVEQHSVGSRNHTFLLLAMMIYEVGQRKFADAAREPLVREA